MFIIDNIFFLPLKGFFYLAERVAEELDREHNDRENIQQELLRLRILFEIDEIDEQEYEQREAKLLNRLAVIAAKEEEEEEEEEEEGEDYE